MIRKENLMIETYASKNEFRSIAVLKLDCPPGKSANCSLRIVKSGTHRESIVEKSPKHFQERAEEPIEFLVASLQCVNERY